jgi:hypothetical protein
MDRVEQIAFLSKLVVEEFSRDARVDAEDVLNRTDDDLAYEVLLGETPVYAIPERLVELHNEEDIRRQLRNAKMKFASLLGISIV